MQGSRPGYSSTRRFRRGVSSGSMDRIESPVAEGVKTLVRYVPFLVVPVVPFLPLTLLFVGLGWLLTVQMLGRRDGVPVAVLATMASLIALWIRLTSVSLTVVG